MENMCSSIFTRFFYTLSSVIILIFLRVAGALLYTFHTLFHSKYCIIIQFHIVAANYVKLIYFRRKLRRQQFNQSSCVCDEMRSPFTAHRYALPVSGWHRVCVYACVYL